MTEVHPFCNVVLSVLSLNALLLYGVSVLQSLLAW